LISERSPLSSPADAELRRMHLSSYEEIYEKVYRRLGKLIEKQKHSEKSDSMDEAIEILNTTYNIISEKLETYRRLYKLIAERDELRTYISLVLGEQSLEKLESAARLEGKVRQLYISLKTELLSSERRDLRKKALGMSSRLLSIVKRNRKLLEEVLEIKKEAMLLPDLRGKVAVVIAGPPNSGKSTLATRISNAKTDIAEYPFTTKRAVPGRLLSENLLDITVIDTPGILPRPFSEMNLPERRAVASLKMARGILLFLIDPTPSSTVEIKEQVEMLRKIRGEILEVVPVINKIDAVERERLEFVKNLLTESLGIKDIYFISAAENIGLESLIEHLRAKARELISKEGGGKVGNR